LWIFAPLKELSYFTQVRVNSEVGTVVWLNGADLDPDVLYAVIAGEAIPNYEQISRVRYAREYGTPSYLFVR
jgi:hypothetical protein